MGPQRINVLKIRPKEKDRHGSSLENFEPFRGLTDAEARKVARLIEEKRFPRGTTIFKINDPADSLYALMEGLVKLVSRPGKGTGRILHLLRPPDIFGELLLSEETRPFMAVALTDVLAAVVSRDHFVDLLSSITSVRLNFIRILSRRLAHVESEVSEFSHSWSYHRLAKVLLRTSREHGEATPGGVLIRPPLTHSDLAGMIGTTRETVSNQMGRFKRMGLVRSRGRRLIVDTRRLGDFIRSEEAAPGRDVPSFKKIA
jgi:CRP/FNR family transcriptional regulator